MKTIRFTKEQVRGILLERKVMLREELREEVGCSGAALYKLLKQCDGINSLNKNATYCTLREIAQFDEQGLWSYEDVRFSKYGSLLETIVGIADASEEGLGRRDIENALGPAALPALTKLANTGRIGREQIGRLLVYFSPDDAKMAVQVERRRRLAVQAGIGLPAESVIISVLVGLITNPGICREDLVMLMEEKRVVVSRQEVDILFDHYELEKKGRLIT